MEQHTESFKNGAIDCLRAAKSVSEDGLDLLALAIAAGYREAMRVHDIPYTHTCPTPLKEYLNGFMNMKNALLKADIDMQTKH
jgi:hypothetical protein